MIKYLLILICFFSYFLIYAEGTKEFRPTSGDVGNLQINDKNRPFALESNTDTLNRLYFHIKSDSKKHPIIDNLKNLSRLFQGMKISYSNKKSIDKVKININKLSKIDKYISDTRKEIIVLDQNNNQ